jgi:16S rRNA (guanine966-N2)-methyltransferase
MRIVAGRHRGRPIAAPAGRDIRPTSDRVREAVFNILEHRDWGAGGISVVTGARVLDGFCGTGALGLEALSRGAGHVTFMDKNRAALNLCRETLEALGERSAANLLQGDCLKPVRPAEPCNLVFLDPPYKAGLAGPALEALRNAGWIAPGCVCVVETGAKDNPETPEGFEMLDARKYGAAKIHFMRSNTPSD